MSFIQSNDCLIVIVSFSRKVLTSSLAVDIYAKFCKVFILQLKL